jgi:hypothetical protein
MKTPTDINPPSAPVRLDHVFCWQLAGIFIGAIVPTAVVAFVPEGSWLPVGLVLAPLTATLGAILGTIVGFLDRHK